MAWIPIPVRLSLLIEKQQIRFGSCFFLTFKALPHIIEAERANEGGVLYGYFKHFSHGKD